MTTLTDDARMLYDQYVRRVHTVLTAAGAPNPDDVVADIRDHVDRELEGLAEPVSDTAMEGVLTRLGQPQQWIGDDQLSWWRKTLLRVRTGPEDWRLAYATFGTILLALLFGGLLGETVLVVLWAGSFILARAAIATAGESNDLTEGQKWLVYPSLVPVYALLLAAVFLGPAAGVGDYADSLSYQALREYPAGDLPRAGYYPLLESVGITPGAIDVRSGILAIYAAALTAGISWTILGLVLLLKRPRRLTAAVFRPFLDHMSRAWGVTLLVIGLVLLALCVMATVAAHAWGHHYF